MRHAAFKCVCGESAAEYRVRWQAGMPAPHRWQLRMPAPHTWEAGSPPGRRSPLLGFQAIQRPAVVAEDDDAFGDRWAGGDRFAGLEFPELVAGLEIEHVEALVLPADVNFSSGDRGTRVDVAFARAELPQRLAGGGFHRVHVAVAGADDDDAVAHRREG